MYCTRGGSRPPLALPAPSLPPPPPPLARCQLQRATPQPDHPCFGHRLQATGLLSQMNQQVRKQGLVMRACRCASFAVRFPRKKGKPFLGSTPPIAPAFHLQLQKLRDKNQRAADEAATIQVQLAGPGDAATYAASQGGTSAAAQSSAASQQGSIARRRLGSASTAAAEAAEQYRLAEELLAAAASFRAAPEAAALLAGLAEGQRQQQGQQGLQRPRKEPASSAVERLEAAVDACANGLLAQQQQEECPLEGKGGGGAGDSLADAAAGGSSLAAAAASGAAAAATLRAAASLEAGGSSSSCKQQEQSSGGDGSETVARPDGAGISKAAAGRQEEPEQGLVVAKDVALMSPFIQASQLQIEEGCSVQYCSSKMAVGCLDQAADGTVWADA